MSLPEIPKLVTAALYSFIYVFILVPTLVWCSLRYWRSCNIPVIRQRYFEIALIINMAVILYLLINKPCAMFAGAMGVTMDYRPTPMGKLLQTIVDVTIVFTAHSVTIGILIRGWLLRYDILFAKACDKGKWKQLIAPDSIHTNFYYTHKDSFGNVRWMLTKVYLPWWIFTVLATGLPLAMGYSMVYTIVDNLCYVFELISIGVLWCKTPPLRDLFRIRDEFLLVVKWGLFGTICSIVSAVFEMAVPYFFIHFSFFQMIFALVMWCFGMIPTYWVLFRSGIIISEMMARSSQSQLSIYIPNGGRMQMGSISTTPIPTTPVGGDDGDSHGGDGKKRMKVGVRNAFLRTLSDNEGFAAFMDHLFMEFSSENLLALVELSQFQRYVTATHSCAECNPDAEANSLPSNKAPTLRPISSQSHIDDSIIFAPKVPHSAIVYSDTMDLAEKCAVLCERYVLVGSPFQVNLSFDVRKPLESGMKNDRFADLQCSEFETVFEKVVDQLSRLLRLDSFSRFRGRSEFSQLVLFGGRRSP